MTKLGFIVASIASLAAMGIAYSAWQARADIEVDAAGYMGWVGVGLVALAGGAGLMALLFWSNRKGFDDRAGARPKLQRREPPHQN